ncbi:MAG TPA: multidrug resistance efflux transporter family protein [Anaerolineales bacterium]|nr:multidrug resistance efflux transporter family protein [Anaerolineales bacterium]HMX75863.1 multidrug resistance efflux transporter family protein [Anaerolineales bacterium]HMZ44929.1 multidrug resistance efflux transporter family protein [Anaerolineales bacterium]HNB88278.1 multidrug resistance efflux transporter family protein [Anaerolineales bacterium]HND93692.1 multidrug resistance efflux transporter family protein [Anaerolineales bacterium]
MTRLIAIGSLAALFFSSTFVLNRAMSLQGGHWAWTSSLRFGFMLIFLILLLLATQGKKALVEVRRVFLSHWLFWILAGSIGFGVFYSLITFSSQYAAGWVVATTWQTTILATPIVLVFFGRKVPTKGLLFTGIIFVGIILVNIEHAALTSLREVLFSALPVLIAAFAYPIGNQLVWEARMGHNARIPKIENPILENGFARVLLLTLGSIPFWVLILLFSSPPAPASGQLLSTALVALLSGVIATTLFLYARHLCHQPYEIAAVDATQSMEVVFSLIGEIVFLHGAFPGPIGFVGVALTILGLIAYMKVQAN